MIIKSKKKHIPLVKYFLYAVILVGLIVVGIGIGLIAAGFFGTLSNPSEVTIDFLHYIGINNLRELKLKAEWIKQEKFYLHDNFIKGKLSNPDKIFIDIKFQDFQKLEQKRNEALDTKLLIASAEDYVPATIRYDDKEYRVKLRLKGDAVDHLETDKWSMRIKVRGNETLFGMKIFSIQTPKTRNYVHEFIYQQALKRDGVIGIRYNFIEVVINGEEKGIFALEEHFEKRLIENNSRINGPILKFNDDYMWERMVEVRPYYDNQQLWDFQQSNSFEWYNNSIIESFDNKTNPLRGIDLLQGWREGRLNLTEVFDLDILAKYFAINTLFTADHSSKWVNIRFYYNPMTDKLEPIGFDGIPGASNSFFVLDGYFNEMEFENLFLRDELLLNKFIDELERVSEKEYLDELFQELELEIKSNVNIIRKDLFIYHYSNDVYYENQKQIKLYLKRLNKTDLIELKEDKVIIMKDTIIMNNLTFYEKDVYLDNVSFININAEDNLNLVRSSFIINNSHFINCSMDCFDSDFSNGKIINTQFRDCGNDCIDFSGSFVDVKNVSIIGAGDKGISVGEASIVNLKDIWIDNTNIGVAAKDNSIATINNVNVNNSIINFSVYQKKSEFGVGEIFQT